MGGRGTSLWRMYFASARIGPPLNRGSIVALKSFETENNAAFPLPFRGFVIKNTSSLLQLANFVIFFKALSTDLSFKSATFSFRIQKFTRPHVIGFVADLFFFTLESGLTISGYAGNVWMAAVSGKKKLWIQKYLDMCRRGLNSWLLSFLKYWFTAALNWL